MASRYFNQFKGSLEKGVVFLDGALSLSAAGAVVSNSMMGASIAKTGTGEYTVTLQDSYPKLLSISLTPVSAVTNVNGIWKLSATKDASGAVTNLINVRQLVLVCSPASGVPTDPAVVSGVTISLTLKNSVV